MSGQFRSVAIIVRPYLRHLLLDLAARLKQDFGSEIHFYFNDAQGYRLIDQRNAGDIVDSMEKLDYLMPWPPRRIDDEAALFERASRLEERYGSTINYLTVFDRHHGRGYGLGGFNFPRSYQSERMSYAQSVDVICDGLEFWQNEIDQKGITLVLNPSNLTITVAQASGIPIRSMADSRHKNYYAWLIDEFDANPEIANHYNQLQSETVPTETLDLPQAHRETRKRMIGEITLRSVAKFSADRFARNIYRKLRRYKKAHTYFASSQTRYKYRQWADYRKLTSEKNVTTLEKIKGTKFVFYPLHTEPERALQGLSPENFSQLSCIAALARDLPADVRLVVKEHIAGIGARPADFHRQIAEFKNVIMLDLRETGLDVVREAKAVATITSTAGMEAAIMGKPVISFGRHNAYNLLPHVEVVHDLGSLRPQIEQALSPDFDAAKASQNGSRFLEALRRASFDMSTFSAHEPTSANLEICDIVYNALVKSLAGDENAAERMAKAASS
jgi:hypothetical protein